VQSVAGTGNDTRPNRVLNPLRQARRFDPDGRYVRRYLRELVAIDGAAVHTPWRADPAIVRMVIASSNRTTTSHRVPARII
jgi:deoxyribodipyrimidine photolyase